MRRIGLFANPDKGPYRRAVREAARLIARARRVVLAETVTARFAGLQLREFESLAALGRQTDLVVVFGGDGTMLRAARELAVTRTPVFGLNIGGLGFLTAAPSRRLVDTFESIWAGRIRVEPRVLLEASGRWRGHAARQVALNDFVIGRSMTSRMIELGVEVDGQELTRYRCDGLIVSSPTGSTAYSLSAGGAVVSPSAEVMALTPICPHTLSNRSVIVSLDSEVRVRVLSRRLETVLTADGQVQIELAAGDVVTVRRSGRAARLVHLADSSFFETLRRKLHWSGSHV